MLGFFKKKIYSYPADSRWTVAKGLRDTKPIFVRRNESASSLAGHPQYKYRAGVAIPLKEPNADGLPSESEMTTLNTIEDRLSEVLEKNQDSIQVLSITTNGMREFVFYSRSPASVRSTIEEFQREIQSHEVQGYISEDPNWSLYSEFNQ